MGEVVAVDVVFAAAFVGDGGDGGGGDAAERLEHQRTMAQLEEVPLL